MDKSVNFYIKFIVITTKFLFTVSYLLKLKNQSFLFNKLCEVTLTDSILSLTYYILAKLFFIFFIPLFLVF